MMVAGIVGGIGSGKSHVARQFRELGAETIDADKLGHEVLRNPVISGQISAHFGAEILNSEGTIDRALLAKRVFGKDTVSQKELSLLESITHPAIGELVQARLEQLKRQKVPLVILDAPLLFESGWDRFCDRVIYVDSNLASRLERMRARGWTQDDLVARELRQTPLVEKRRWSTDVITNHRSNDPDSVRIQVRALWSLWMGGGGTAPKAD